MCPIKKYWKIKEKSKIISIVRRKLNFLEHLGTKVKLSTLYLIFVANSHIKKKRGKLINHFYKTSHFGNETDVTDLRSH